MPTDIQSANRCLDILECLAEAGRPVILSEIVAMTGLATSTAHSLLSTLARRGYVLHVGPRQGYTLGPAIRTLAEKLGEPYDVAAIASPYLGRLRELVDGESVYLGLFQGWKVVPALYIASESLLAAGRSPVTTALHSSAQGKVLLAEFSDSELDRWIRFHGLNPVTPHTITDETKLREVLGRVRREGYATADEESSEGVCSLAAPVRGPRDKAVAAVAVGCPKIRMNAERWARYAVYVRGTAAEISRELAGEMKGRA